jgi:hypothetical protein
VATTIRVPRVFALSAVADVVAVVVFAAIGRASHDESDGIVGILAVAAPFLVGLLVAWATPWVRARPQGFRAGVVVLAATVVVGLGLRAAFLGRLPLTFALVTLAALAVLLLGWRGVSALVAATALRRSARTGR